MANTVQCRQMSTSLYGSTEPDKGIWAQKQPAAQSAGQRCGVEKCWLKMVGGENINLPFTVFCICRGETGPEGPACSQSPRHFRGFDRSCCLWPGTENSVKDSQFLAI